MSRKWLSPALVALMAVAALAFWSELPERIPTHYDFSGRPDDWMPKWPGALLFPALGLGVWLLLLGLRAIDPRRAHYDRFEDTYWKILNVLTLVFALEQAAIVAMGLGVPLEPGRANYFILGLLLALLGNWMPRIKSNWWMGIRTPWTLESEAVWRSTHRLAGWLFVASGIVVMAAALFLERGVREWVGTPAIALAIAVPFVYSYLAYRREKAAGAAA